ncbi:hypothetical protein MKW98_021416, partial [Papaver atlanticum]
FLKIQTHILCKSQNGYIIPEHGFSDARAYYVCTAAVRSNWQGLPEISSHNNRNTSK